MSKPLVMLIDNLYADADFEKEYFESRGCSFRAVKGKDEAGLINEIREADALLLYYAKITDRIIDSLEHCKVIIRVGTGYDNIDVVAATNKGIPVCNVRNYCSDEVAEHALAMALSLLRRIPLLNDHTHAGIWNPDLANGISRISDLTLGIYGFGNIGRALAEKSGNIFKRIIAYGPTVDEKEYKKRHVERVTNEDELFARADVLSLHVPMNERNAGLITYEKLCKMKSTAFFINTARGGLVDEEGLIKALHEERIAGAALDVIATDQPDQDDPLFKEPNVIITPHIAYISKQSVEDLRRIAAEQVMDALEGRKPVYQVN